MKYFYAEPSYFYKTILLENNLFHATDEEFKTEEELLGYLAKEKKSVLDSIAQGNVNDVSEIRVFPLEYGIQLFFLNNKQKSEKAYFQFSTSLKYEEALRFFMDSRTYKQEVVQKNQLLPNIKVLVAPLVALLFTVALYLMAQQGNFTVSGGRRRGLKTLLASIATTLTPVGCLVAGLIVTGILVYVAYKKIKQSRQEITVYKPA